MKDTNECRSSYCECDPGQCSSGRVDKRAETAAELADIAAISAKLAPAGPLPADALRRIGNWLLGDDTGISSKTMAAIALGSDQGYMSWHVDAPHDPSDFARCYRLVQAVPEIRAAFPRIAERVPPFAGILERWDELCAVFDREAPTGRCVELYAMIKALRGDWV